MKNFILLIFSFFFTSLSYGGFQWNYEEKIGAETRCNNTFRENVGRTGACILGVTAYGDARGWQGLNTTRTQALTACQRLCTGAGELLVYCQNGCQFGRNLDL